MVLASTRCKPSTLMSLMTNGVTAQAVFAAKNRLATVASVFKRKEGWCLFMKLLVGKMANPNA